MRKVSKRTIKTWLQNWSAPRPPESLAEIIKKEIPEGISLRIEKKDHMPIQKRAGWLKWQVAACALIFIAGTLIGIWISQTYFTGVTAEGKAWKDQAQRRQPVTGPLALRERVSQQHPSKSEDFIAAALKPRSSFEFDAQPASFNIVQSQIKKGKLPPPELVHFDDIINHFRLEDATPPKDDFAIWTEGGSSPFTSDPAYKVFKINIRARDLQSENQDQGKAAFLLDSGDTRKRKVEDYLRIVARDTHVEIEFNPTLVDVYRRIGTRDEGAEKEPVCDMREKDIRACDAATALYELKLRKEIEPDDSVATLMLQYSPAGDEEAGVKKINTIKVPLFVTQSGKASANLEFAALVAQYAQMLKNVNNAEKNDFQSLANRARLLVKELPKKGDVEEFIQLVQETEKLKKLILISQPESYLDTKQKE